MTGHATPENLVLTDRDYELLLSTYHFRYLTTSQVQHLHFPSWQTAARRIRGLTAAGYLRSVRVQRIDEHVITLTDQGISAVAAYLGVSAADFNRQGFESPECALRYPIQVNDLCIALTEACRATGKCRLLGFMSEPLELSESTLKRDGSQCSPSPLAWGPTHRIVHAPDAVFAVEYKRQASLFFLEIDRGISFSLDLDLEHSPQRILGHYLAMQRDGSHKRYFEHFAAEVQSPGFQILVAVKSIERIAALRRTWMHESPAIGVARHIWLSQRSGEHDHIFDRRWEPLDQHTPAVGLLDLAALERSANERGALQPDLVSESRGTTAD
jgi:hypothetical protein